MAHPFRWSLIAVASALLSLLAPTSVTASEWQLAKRQDDITVYTRPVKGSPYDAFRAGVKIHSPFETVLAILADTPSNCEWMHGCGLSKVLKQVSLTERYIYQINLVPAPLWHRDLIMHSKARINADGDEVTIDLRATPAYCDDNPLEECRNRSRQKAGRDYVRIGKAEGFYRIRRLSDRWTEVVWQMHAEPGGDIMGWMANLQLTDIPFNTLYNLKRLAERSQNGNAHIALNQIQLKALKR